MDEAVWQAARCDADVSRKGAPGAYVEVALSGRWCLGSVWSVRVNHFEAGRELSHVLGEGLLTPPLPGPTGLLESRGFAAL